MSVNYLATLTYFYRNPDLQSGDYCELGEDEEADARDCWRGVVKMTARWRPDRPLR